MSGIVVRAPRPSDAEAIAALMGELGYPSAADEITPRLEAIRAAGDALIVWVAELDGRVVGLGTGRVTATVNADEPAAQLTLLVVAQSARGRGVGKRLVRVAEEWARARGATTLTLTSALHRVEAHDFYKRLGYEHTGVRLAKTLR